MNVAALTTSAWSAPLEQFWGQLARRERLGLVWAGTAVALALVWFIAIAPAWRTASLAPARLEALDTQLQEMRRLAQEARELRNVSAPPVTQSEAALNAATGRLGDHGKMSLQGDRVVLTLNQASGEELQAWLATARSAARARAVEAQLTRSASGGYAGTIVVALGARP